MIDRPRAPVQSTPAEVPAMFSILPPVPLTLTYDKPAIAWTEALPLGNGRIGAMYFGGVEEDRLQLNDGSLWAGEPRLGANPDARNVLPEVRKALFEGRYADADRLCHKMQGPYTESYLPLGDLRLTFAPAGEVTGYRRDLDLGSAVSSVEYRSGGVRYRRRSSPAIPPAPSSSGSPRTADTASRSPSGSTARSTRAPPPPASASSWSAEGRNTPCRAISTTRIPSSTTTRRRAAASASPPCLRPAPEADPSQWTAARSP
jgi:hypothetical protein